MISRRLLFSDLERRIFYVSCVGLLLCLTLSRYASSYFYYDDFNCMFLAQQETWLSMVGHVLNPISTYFRPLYMVAYWVEWNLFGLNPLPYHLFKWMLHGTNALLLFILLKELVSSEYAVAGAVGLFSYQIAFREIFFNFACLGELLTLLLMIVGLLVYIRSGESLKGQVLCFGIYFLALKAKEMAVTLPAVWLLYELTVRRGTLFALLPGTDSVVRHNAMDELKMLIRRFSPFFLIAIGYLFLKVPIMGGLVPYPQAGPSHPYYLAYSPSALLESFTWYFNTLLRVRWPSLVWLILWVSLLVAFLWRRQRTALFFFLYIFLAFGPVIPLVNRRLPYYWYVPSLGLAGLIALAVTQLRDWLQLLFPARWLTVPAACFFVAVMAQHCTSQRAWTKPMMLWVDKLTEENRNFVGGLQALPPPPPNETIFFQSMPRYFDSIGAKSIVQVVFRRTDLDGRIVSTFPPGAKYCIRFENSRILLAREWDPPNHRNPLVLHNHTSAF